MCKRRRLKKETYLLLQGVVQGGELIDLDLLALLVLSLLVAELAQTLAESSSRVRLGLASDRGNGLTDSVLLEPGKRKTQAWLDEFAIMEDNR